MNLDAYFERIGYGGGRGPTLDTLRELHEAHTGAVPFENINVLLGRPISLDLADLERKIVGERRGGYCFEQNHLFRAVLEGLGFTVRSLAARVRMGSSELRPRTHQLLLVIVEGRPYVTDVGFGGHGMIEPLPLATGTEFRFPVISYRFARDGEEWVLQATLAGGWLDLYSFTLEAFLPPDFVVLNHFTSTFPRSPFVLGLRVQQARRSERLVLTGRELTILRPEGETRRVLDSRRELARCLAESFGLAPDVCALAAERVGFE